MCVFVLERTGARQHAWALLNALSDSSEDVRAAAASVLGSLDVRSAVPILIQTLEGRARNTPGGNDVFEMQNALSDLTATFCPETAVTIQQRTKFWLDWWEKHKRDYGIIDPEAAPDDE